MPTMKIIRDKNPFSHQDFMENAKLVRKNLLHWKKQLVLIVLERYAMHIFPEKIMIAEQGAKSPGASGAFFE